MSYADLVTLLFACFTTAYAASAAQPAASTQAAVPEPVVTEAHQPDRSSGNPALRELLAPALAGGLDDVDIEMTEDARGLVLSLPDTATFSSGSADLTPDAKALLTRIAGALRSTDVRIRIEGHTDDEAIRGGRYRSNWELSTARASAVVVFLVTEAGYEPRRLSAAGYGEFHPKRPNDDPAARALNRRVDVVVIDPKAPVE